MEFVDSTELIIRGLPDETAEMLKGALNDKFEGFRRACYDLTSDALKTTCPVRMLESVLSEIMERRGQSTDEYHRKNRDKSINPAADVLTSEDVSSN